MGEMDLQGMQQDVEGLLKPCQPLSLTSAGCWWLSGCWEDHAAEH